MPATVLTPVTCTNSFRPHTGICWYNYRLQRWKNRYWDDKGSIQIYNLAPGSAFKLGALLPLCGEWPLFYTSMHLSEWLFNLGESFLKGGSNCSISFGMGCSESQRHLPFFLPSVSMGAWEAGPPNEPATGQIVYSCPFYEHVSFVPLNIEYPFAPVFQAK